MSVLIMQPAWRDVAVYLLIAVPVAIAFALLTPPMQTPDEVGHYWRSVAVSQGELVYEKNDGKPSALIPTASRKLVGTVWMDMAGRQVKYDVERLRRARELRNTDDKVRVHFPAFYTAAPYVPQAVTLLIARVIRVPPLAAFYLGRMANALAGILLVALAMRAMPKLAWAFAMVGLTPMFLYLAGSYSADTLTTGIAFSAIAYALRLWEEEGTRRLWAIFIALSFLLALAKPAYLLIPLLSLPLWRVPRARPLIAASIVAMASGAAIAAWTARIGYFAMRPDLLANPSAQLTHMTHYPMRVAAAVLSDYGRHTSQYFDHFVGRLGWLDIGLPQYVERAFLAAFIYVALATHIKLSWGRRLWIAAIFAGSLVMVSVSQYMIWTPVGSSDVDGIQGRYFLPVFPLLLIALSGSWPKPRWWIPASIAIVCNAVAIRTLFNHYY
jgi:uncharacterized membrane protein